MSTYETTFHQCDQLLDTSKLHTMMGCDGRDNDCDLLIDECDEDFIPPVINFKMGYGVDAYERESDGLTIINSPAFASLEEARLFLESIVIAKDDCAAVLNIEVTSPSESTCENTTFAVTVTDPRCSETNPIQTVVRRFAIKVDEIAPTTSIIFEHGRDEVYGTPEVDPDFLYLHIDESAFNFENVLFSYQVDDNCDQQIETKIKVSSNEFAYDNAKTNQNMVLIRETRDERQSHRIQIFVETERCDRAPQLGFDQLKPLCFIDPNSPYFRFYQIDIEVTDYASNVGTTQAWVIIMPLQFDQLDSYTADHPQNSNEDYWINYVRAQVPNNVIGTQLLEWQVPDSSPTKELDPGIKGQEKTTATDVVTAKMTFSGMSMPSSDEEYEELKKFLQTMLAESLEIDKLLGPTATVTVSILDDAIVSRKLERSQYRRLNSVRIEYQVSVERDCNGGCDTGENIDPALLSFKDNMSDKVSGESFVDRLKQEAKADGLSLLDNVQVEDVEVSDSVTSTIEKSATISFGNVITLPVSNFADLSIEETELTALALAPILQTLGCPNDLSVKSCSANIVGVTNRPGSLPERRLSAERKLVATRLLQSQVLEFSYQFSLEVMCPPSGCDADLTTAAAALEEAVTNSLTQAAESGQLGTELAVISGVTSFLFDELSFGSLPDPCQAHKTGYYPDVAGKSGTCKNDGNAPEDMQSFYDSLEECCRDNYDETYHICVGDTVDWYPAWNVVGEKCLNDANRLSEYMIGADQEAGFLSETLDECCNRWYNWNPEGCISDSGGVVAIGPAIAASNEWYVIWGGNQGNRCVQDCLTDTGQTQYGLAGLNCGGLAPPSKSLYATLDECCAEQLPWMAPHKCKNEALPPPAEVRGTSRWYVAYQNNKCVQDCSVNVSPTCGGIITQAYVALFDNSRLCCEEKLRWKDVDECESDSHHIDYIVI